MEVLKAIEIALENESKERDFYLRNSERTKNPIGKKMFATIAGEEDDHYNHFKQLHESLSGTQKWPENISAIVKGTEIKKALAKLDSMPDDSSVLDIDDNEAIKIAIEFEKGGYAFYTKLKENAESEDEKKFFGQLAQVEYSHLSSLEDTLLYFEDPEAWHAKHEGSNLDG